jgi:hypothetical protein
MPPRKERVVDMDEATKVILAGVVRHLLGGVAASLVTMGALQASQQAQFLDIVSGIVVAAVVAVLWWWKNRAQKKVADALKKVTNRATTDAAVKIAEVVPAGSAVTPNLPAKPL